MNSQIFQFDWLRYLFDSVLSVNLLKLFFLISLKFEEWDRTIINFVFFEADVGGQHCPCPVRVSFLSGFSGKFCPVSVRCPDSVRIFCQVSVCPESVCLDSVRCPDSVRIFRKKAVRCPSVRVFSVSILSGVWILSGFLEKMLSGVCLSGFFCLDPVRGRDSVGYCPYELR